jgi:hypothetical protein
MIRGVREPRFDCILKCPRHLLERIAPISLSTVTTSFGSAWFHVAVPVEYEEYIEDSDKAAS